MPLRRRMEDALVATENVQRHPSVGAYLMAQGAKGIVHKREHGEIQDLVTRQLVTSAPEIVKSAVAGTANLG